MITCTTTGRSHSTHELKAPSLFYGGRRNDQIGDTIGGGRGVGRGVGPAGTQIDVHINICIPVIPTLLIIRSLLVTPS